MTHPDTLTGCPYCPGHHITDPDQHRRWHALVAEQTGDSTSPMTLNDLRDARGITYTLPDVSRTRQQWTRDAWQRLAEAIDAGEPFTTEQFLALCGDPRNLSVAEHILHTAEADRRLVGDGRRWTPVRPVGPRLDRVRVDTGLDAPVESHRAADAHAARQAGLSRNGTDRARTLALVAVRGARGATSDEVERQTNRLHQSVSACLYGLEKDGLVTHDGPVRQTRSGEDARAYLVTAFGLAELRRIEQARPAPW